MNRSFTNGLVRPTALAMIATAAACGPYIGLDDVLGTGDVFGSRSIVSGEIRSVDTRRGTISLRDGRSRSHTLRTDRGTSVVYRQSRYPVSALERGDRVRVSVSTDQRGTRWADRIEVTHSTRSAGGRDGRVYRADGRVSRIDHRRGSFRLDQGRATIVVHLPRRIDRDDAHRFQRLRNGDRVRVDVRPLGRNEAELVRFR